MLSVAKQVETKLTNKIIKNITLKTSAKIAASNAEQSVCARLLPHGAFPSRVAAGRRITEVQPRSRPAYRVTDEMKLFLKINAIPARQ